MRQSSIGMHLTSGHLSFVPGISTHFVSSGHKVTLHLATLGQFGGGMAKGARIGAKGAGKRASAALARQLKR